MTQYCEYNRPLNENVNDFFESYKGPEIFGPSLGETHLWLINSITIDTSLRNEVSKRDAPNALRTSAMETIERYKGCVQLYTDASRTEEGCGIGCYIHSDEHDIDPNAAHA